MKKQTILSLLVMLASTNWFVAQGAWDYIINKFNSASEASQWVFEYGIPTHSESWDSTVDADNNTNSGSLKLQLTFDIAANDSTNKAGYYRNLFPGLNGPNLGLTRLKADIKVAPGSAETASGDNGIAQFALRNDPSWMWMPQWGTNVDSDSGWIHVDVPLTGTYDDIQALSWELYGAVPQSLTGATTVWIDNVMFEQEGSFLAFPFDTGDQGWAFNFGSASGFAAWDNAEDAGGNPNSGSLYCTGSFASNATQYAWQDCAFQRWNMSLPTLAHYDKIALDIKVDAANSILSAGGNYEGVSVVLRGTDIDWTEIGPFTISATNTNWVHFEATLPQPLPTNLVGMNLYFRPSPHDFNYRGEINYWIDNIAFVVVTNPPPPPTLAIKQALPGLELNACGSGQYQRQSIRTLDGNYNWVSAPGAVTYSMTINEGLSAQAAGMMAYMFLIGTSNPDPAPDGDYSEPNGIFLEMHEQTNGLCTATLTYKTNAPGSHGIRYTTNGLLAVVTNQPMVGTWSLTLNQTNFGLSTPGGTITNVTVAPEVLTEFSDSLFAYFGVQPNDLVNLNQYVTLSRARISGVSPAVDELFTSQSSLNTNVFVVRAQNPAGIQMRPPNTVYRLSWSTPATGYKLRSTASLSPPPTWSSPGLPAIIAGTRILTFLPSTSLPSAGKGFFRLQTP